LWTTTCPISGSCLSPACCQPFCLSSLCLLNIHVEISSLLLPPLLQCAYSTPPPLLCFSFQYLFYCSVFCCCCFVGQGGLSAQWAMLVYPMGGWGEYHVMLGAYLLVCRMSPKQAWSWHMVAQEPSCFLSVIWYGEDFHRLGVQGVEVLNLLGALFLRSVAPVCQQYF
jgi:hypothetical protein